MSLPFAKRYRGSLNRTPIIGVSYSYNREIFMITVYGTCLKKDNP